MKSKFKKISDSINIITNNHFESIIEYEGNLWKVIIDNDINNNTLFELSEVNSYFIFQKTIEFNTINYSNGFKELVQKSIIKNIILI